MFPAAILFALAELLIPELARCSAAGSTARIRHLTERSLLLALLYGCLCGGILFLWAEPLCERLYHTKDAGIYLRLFSLLAPMLYCDAIVDAMTKGLGQQKICVRYNIITSAMDVILLFLLLPRLGMQGYFISFFVTHLINFILSIRLLRRLVGRLIPFHRAVFSLLGCTCGILAALMLPDRWQIVGFLGVFSATLILLGVIRRKDLTWLKGLVFPTKQQAGDC